MLQAHGSWWLIFATSFPILLICFSRYAPFMLQVMAMSHTVHAVQDLRVCLH
jgi:hypothetical protein